VGRAAGLLFGIRGTDLNRGGLRRQGTLITSLPKTGEGEVIKFEKNKGCLPPGKVDASNSRREYIFSENPSENFFRKGNRLTWMNFECTG